LADWEAPPSSSGAAAHSLRTSSGVSPMPARGKGGKACSDVVFEPQRGDLAKPRPTAWVNGTPINPEP
jgi:hypothetical protein